MKNFIYAIAAGTMLLTVAADAAAPAAPQPARQVAGIRFAQTPVTKNNLYIRILQFSGDMNIDGWTTNPIARFWVNVAVSGRPLAIDFTRAKAWVDSCFNDPRCANRSTEWLGVATYNDHGSSIDRDYAQRLTDLMFKLESPLSRAERNDTALKNFVAAGANPINVKVKPRSPNWSVTFQLYTLSDDGHEAVIQETHLDQGTGGTAPTVNITIP